MPALKGNIKKEGAPYGNRNAEKWSFKKSIQLFDSAIKLSKEKETYTFKDGKSIITVNGYKFDFIGEIAKELGTFKEIFSHLVKRFPVLSRKHNELITNIESSCYYNTKRGLIREATGIVNLKSNHKWTDRNENTHNITDDIKELMKPFREKKSE